ncbi:MAG: ATP-binding cassette domain-containing protein [Actinomycetes bacterium]
MSLVLDLHDVSVIRDGATILGPLSWTVSTGERWVVLGPNGAGKSTLFALAGSIIHPSRGVVSILDAQMGRTDVFELRPRIGMTSSAIVELIPEDEIVINVVMTSAYAIIGRWQENYDLWDESRALSLLTILGVRGLKDRTFGTLSEGEKKRVLIARALMPNPELLLLDEPAAGLDLGGREDLLRRLNALALDPASPATIIVTHHVEEIPLGTTHCLLLSDGLVVAQGELKDVLTSHNLSVAYDIAIEVQEESGRYFARASD